MEAHATHSDRARPVAWLLCGGPVSRMRPLTEENPMILDDYDQQFREVGSLAAAAAELVPMTRDLSGECFELAERVSGIFQRLTMKALDGPHTTAGDPKVVALLLALRCASACQGAIFMAERGMSVEARLLIRSVLEGALCLGALHDQPTTFMDMLWKDAEASRKAQGKFILENDLVAPDSDQKAKLEEAISKIEKVQNLSIKDVAALSPLRRLYFMYRVLSNDSAHPSAKSLSRYIMTLPDGSGWTGFTVGASLPEETDDCLLLLVQAMTAAGVATTQIIGDLEGNRAIGELSDDLRSLMAKRRAEAGS